MNPAIQKPSLTCGGQCDQCLPSVSAGENDSRNMPAGGRLVWLSMVVFLLPLLTATIGASLARERGIHQVGGAALGPISGIFIAWLIYRFLYRKNAKP